MTTLPDSADARAQHCPGLSRIGALLADPGGAAMLWSLMDGTARLARPSGRRTRRPHFRFDAHAQLARAFLVR